MKVMEKKMRVAIYGRCSTEIQTVENQLIDLRRYCRERGWDIQGEYTDTISGTIDNRPGLNALMEVLRKKRANVLLCWRFDRVARSSSHLLKILEECKHLSVTFISLQENVDTGSPLGQAIFTIISAMACLERDIIVERVKAGLRRARDKDGIRLGRPPLKIDADEVLRLRATGLSIRAIAKKVNAPKSVVARALQPKTRPVPNTL